MSNYKQALKSGLFDFQIARDIYRESVNTTGIGMHKDLVLKYIEYQALMLAPIAPHFAEYLYREVLGKMEVFKLASSQEPQSLFPKLFLMLWNMSEALPDLSVKQKVKL